MIIQDPKLEFDWSEYGRILTVTTDPFFFQEKYPLQFLLADAEDVIILIAGVEKDRYITHDNVVRNAPDFNAILSEAAMILESGEHEGEVEHVFLANRKDGTIFFDITTHEIVDYSAFTMFPTRHVISTLVVFDTKHGTGIRKVYNSGGILSALFMRDVTKDLIIPRDSFLGGAQTLLELAVDYYELDPIIPSNFSTAINPFMIDLPILKTQYSVLSKFREKNVPAPKVSVDVKSPGLYDDVGNVKLSWIIANKRLPAVDQFRKVVQDVPMPVQANNIEMIGVANDRIYFYMYDVSKTSTTEIAQSLLIPLGSVNITFSPKPTDDPNGGF